MAKGCSKLDTLCAMWLALDVAFRDFIDEQINTNGEGSSLLRLVRIHRSQGQVSFPTKLFNTPMQYYTDENGNGIYCFRVCGGQCMNVTLEDVLYLTGLPITGKPIIPENSKDLTAFDRVFGLPQTPKLSLVRLKSICVDQARPTEQRLKAVLLMIVCCIIVPDSSGHECYTSYVQFVEELDKVDSYAWGAALLSYLYQGMKQYKDGRLVDGFLWIVLGFFFSRFDLYKIFGIGLQPEVPHTLETMVKEISRKIGKNHYSKRNHHILSGQLADLESLLRSTEAVIKWHPYTPEMLPDHLHDQVECCTFIGPLFCYNYVEYHRPHVVSRQFRVLDNIDLDLTAAESELKTIVFKANRGSNVIDFKKHYEEQLRLWGSNVIEFKKRLAQNYGHPATSENPTEHLHVASTSHPHSLTQSDSSTSQQHHDSPLRPDIPQLHVSAPATNAATATFENPNEHFTSHPHSPPQSDPYTSEQHHDSPLHQDFLHNEGPSEGPVYESHPADNGGGGGVKKVIKRRGLPSPPQEPVKGKRDKKPNSFYTFSPSHGEKMPWKQADRNKRRKRTKS